MDYLVLTFFIFSLVCQLFTLYALYVIKNLISKGETNLSTDLTTLQNDVAAEETVEASVVTLLQNLTQAVKDAGTDPVALKAVTDKIEADTVVLAAAVTANTPAAPAPAPPAAD